MGVALPRSQFARRGIAALIFDKRGVGGSSGDWRQATPDDLAADGAAAVSRLLADPDAARTQAETARARVQTAYDSGLMAERYVRDLYSPVLGRS